ncbi:MAG: hypothetical protein F4Z06_09610 [Acidimicrobiia bacterium]|nr:hypothetical protein [Acidimicrobiia bacterium]MYE72704.1 hypothetical protein [Acidimicrobiia bacterium]MYJ61581.1 hypothetical protein [Acidimicrobiia bacterium]
MSQSADKQTEVLASTRGRVMCMDSAYDVDEANRGRDVCVNSSYCGVLPARFIAEHRPRAAIGMDCGVGPEGSAIAGLWYLEALGIPAAVADVMTAHLGDGVHLYEHGVVSFVNQLALDCGVSAGMAVREAAAALLDNDPVEAAASEITNRTVMETSPDGRCVVAADSIAFGTAEDTDRNVLVTAGHTGRSAVPYLRRCRPIGFICSDGGRGMDDSGMAGLYIVEADGLAGATVDARRARMGSGLSHYHDGIISAANALAATAGVEVGMPCPQAASLLLNR